MRYIYTEPHFCEKCKKKTEPCKRYSGVCFACHWFARNHNPVNIEKKKVYYAERWQKLKADPIKYAAHLKKQALNHAKRQYALRTASDNQAENLQQSVGEAVSVPRPADEVRVQGSPEPRGDNPQG